MQPTLMSVLITSKWAHAIHRSWFVLVSRTTNRVGITILLGIQVISVITSWQSSYPRQAERTPQRISEWKSSCRIIVQPSCRCRSRRSATLEAILSTPLRSTLRTSPWLRRWTPLRYVLKDTSVIILISHVQFSSSTTHGSTSERWWTVVSCRQGTIHRVPLSYPFAVSSSVVLVIRLMDRNMWENNQQRRFWLHWHWSLSSGSQSALNSTTSRRYGLVKLCSSSRISAVFVKEPLVDSRLLSTCHCCRADPDSWASVRSVIPVCKFRKVHPLNYWFRLITTTRSHRTSSSLWPMTTQPSWVSAQLTFE